MKILLIDVDSKIPNIALGKLSHYHKTKGDKVEYLKIGMPYFGKKKEFFFNGEKSGFEKVYASVIFDSSNGHYEIVGDNVEIGGVGVDLQKKLHDKIEDGEIDYSLWPENDISYGFITRGCIRKCYFCKVPKKEGMIHQVRDINGIVRHGKVRFLDNNILGFKDHCKILKDILEDKRKFKFEFNQGLDFRLLNEENSDLLKRLSKRLLQWKYTFAFDDIKYMPIMEERAKYMGWGGPFDRPRFYVYMNKNMAVCDTIRRIQWIIKRKWYVFIMFDIDCYTKGWEYFDFFYQVRSWCNSNTTGVLTLSNFLSRDCIKISDSKKKKILRIWNENQ